MIISYAMLLSGILAIELTMCHLYFLYTHEPLECVHEENTSDKWHFQQCPMRKHCITTLSHA